MDTSQETILIEPKRVETFQRSSTGTLPKLQDNEMYCLERKDENNVETWSKMKCFNHTREQIEAILVLHKEQMPVKLVMHPTFARPLTEAETKAYFELMKNANSFWNKREKEQMVLHQILRDRYPNCSFKWELGQLHINNVPTKIVATDVEKAVTVLEKTFGRINVGKVMAEIIDTKLEEIFLVIHRTPSKY